MNSYYNVVVIGAGPAGLAAASLAADHGASTLLLDEQARPGGQIYRNLSQSPAFDTGVLGSDYQRGKVLTDRVANGEAEYVAGACVWHVSAEREIGVTVGGAAQLISADQIIIATGAQERPFPVSGWTLPGVLNAGAAQILLKSSGLLLPDPVFIGTGPLLYLIASQYLKAGGNVAAVLDTTPRRNYYAALRHLPASYAQMGQLLKGLRWMQDLRKSGTLFVRGVEDVNITGGDAADGVKFKAGGNWQRLETKTVLLHQGVVPNVNLAMAAGCSHVWSESQLCWHACCDEWGQSSVDNIAIAGDSAKITGADCAEVSGALVALAALHRIEKIDKSTLNRLSKPLRRTLSSRAPFRRFLDTLYRPADQFRIPKEDSTLVCRCEEVTSGDIREAVRLGCQGPNQLKSFTRAGMGPCQGRFCGLTVSEMMSAELNIGVAEVGAGRIRSPIKPLELGQLAALADQD